MLGPLLSLQYADCRYAIGFHKNGNADFTQFSSLATPEAIILTQSVTNAYVAFPFPRDWFSNEMANNDDPITRWTS